jgi:hypothetical protein
MAGDIEIFETTKLQLQIEDVIYFLPSYAGRYDPDAYIDWELKVDKEFRRYDLSEEQKVIAASNILTDYALSFWKHLLRHHKVPKTWKVMKLVFREIFVPEYYADHMLDKLNNLKQGKNSVDVYYHDLKFCMMSCGLEEYEEATEIRFLKGLNIEIQDKLLHETYDSLPSLIDLASRIEIQLANDLSAKKLDELLPTCETKNSAGAEIVMCSIVTRFGQNINELFACPSKEDSEGMLVYDELTNESVELLDTSSKIAAPQLEFEHSIFPLVVHNILQE